MKIDKIVLGTTLGLFDPSRGLFGASRGLFGGSFVAIIEFNRDLS